MFNTNIKYRPFYKNYKSTKEYIEGTSNFNSSIGFSGLNVSINSERIVNRSNSVLNDEVTSVREIKGCRDSFNNNNTNFGVGNISTTTLISGSLKRIEMNNFIEKIDSEILQLSQLTDKIKFSNNTMKEQIEHIRKKNQEDFSRAALLEAEYTELYLEFNNLQEIINSKFKVAHPTSIQMEIKAREKEAQNKNKQMVYNFNNITSEFQNIESLKHYYKVESQHIDFRKKEIELEFNNQLEQYRSKLNTKINKDEIKQPKSILEDKIFYNNETIEKLEIYKQISAEIISKATPVKNITEFVNDILKLFDACSGISNSISTILKQISYLEIEIDQLDYIIKLLEDDSEIDYEEKVKLKGVTDAAGNFISAQNFLLQYYFVQFLR